MALLSRLFGGRKKSTSKSPKSYDNIPEFNPWQPVPLEADQVTVLVYRECEQRGRRLLFDSSTVRLVSCAADHAGLIEVENETGFKYTRQRSDAKQLGEMVFGAVAMAYGGPTCKVHLVKGGDAATGGADPSAPDTLMLSRVFPVPRSAGRRVRTHGSSGTSLDDSCSSTGSELSLLRLDGGGYPSPHHPRSSSMDCPPPGGRLSEDSGLSSVDSFMGPPSYLPTPYGTPLSAQGSGASLGSHGSLHRSSRLRPIGSSDLMLTSRDDVTCLRMTSRTRLAVSVLVSLAGPSRSSVLEDTLLQHSVQLEHLLARLQRSVERAYHNRRHFVRTVHQAAAAAKQDLLNLLSAPRLTRPVWLGLTSDGVTSRQRQRLADLFVSELTSLIAELDTKEHNCFVSTLLTAVLTHHLHWVTTVAPRGGGGGRLQAPPPARTLVVGRRTELVGRLLLVLSYFVRAQLVSETMPWSFSPLRATTGSTLTSPGAAATAPDGSCGSLRAPDGSCGSLRAPDGSCGSLRAPDGSCGSLRAPDGSCGSLRAPDGSCGSLRAPDGSCGSLRAPDGFCGSLRAPDGSCGSLQAADARLSGSTTTLRAEEPSEHASEARRTSPAAARGTLALPASGRAVHGFTPAEAAGARSRSRFYVRLDGEHCCEPEEEGVGTTARSRFYRTLPDEKEEQCGAEATECDEGYGARVDGDELAGAGGDAGDSGCDTLDSGCDAAESALDAARPRRGAARGCCDSPDDVTSEQTDASREGLSVEDAECRVSVCRPLPTTPSLVITDTSLCPPAGAASPPAGLLTVPAVVQSRSCEPLGRPAVPAPPPRRRLSRSSADLRAPVRFLVGGDEELPEPERGGAVIARTDAAAEAARREQEEARRDRGRRSRAAGASESSDDDSGFAGCERCAGRLPLDVELSAAAAPPVHAPLSRRHSDSIRDTSHYLRGYRSFRFSQPPPGRPRKARHVSDGSPPSPPAAPLSPPPPPPPPPPPGGRRPCRCLEAAPTGGGLQKQTALLETGRGGPGRQGLSPWAALGGGGGVYVPDMPLWGCDSRPAWEPRLRPDLQAATGAGDECTCVVADTDTYSVQVLSSHAFPVCGGGGGGGRLSGLGVVFSPLVSALVESVCRVQGTGAPAALVLHHLESQLAQLTARAAELAQFLINSSLANMQELTELMSVDSNDVPLLLSAASVLCPEVSSKYGISVR